MPQPRKVHVVSNQSLVFFGFTSSRMCSVSDPIQCFSYTVTTFDLKYRLSELPLLSCPVHSCHSLSLFGADFSVFALPLLGRPQPSTWKQQFSLVPAFEQTGQEGSLLLLTIRSKSSVTSV